MTNREMLNTMSDEELANFLLKHRANCDCCAFRGNDYVCVTNFCVQGIRLWLESEVEEQC